MRRRSRTLLLAGAAVAAAAVSGVVALARPEEPSAAAVDGEVVFVTKGCAGCHSAVGVDVAGMPQVGPSLDHAAAWAGERIDGVSAEDYIAQSIVTPWAFVSPAWRGGAGPTTHMPALGLTDAEVAAVVDFLLSPALDGQG